VQYINTRTKVSITCPIHGDFQQSASSHLQGCGCPNCAHNLKHSKESFIKKANEVHFNKYDYSLVDYVNNKLKIKIVCPFHNIFEQTPGHHLSSGGCSVCAYSKRELLIYD
jgi:hypothetical protein